MRWSSDGVYTHGDISHQLYLLDEADIRHIALHKYALSLYVAIVVDYAVCL